MFPSGSSSTSNPPEQCTNVVINNDQTPEDDGNPGYMNISLEAEQSLGISQQGVYTCTIPDEREVQHTFHVGIYPSTFSSKFFKMLYECMIATQSKLM